MTCVICGCTDDDACDEGCSWVEHRRKYLPLCSSCLTERAVEVTLLLVHLAEHACDGLIRLWDPKKYRLKGKKAVAATCVSVKARRKCEPCRARLLIGAA